MAREEGPQGGPLRGDPGLEGGRGAPVEVGLLELSEQLLQRGPGVRSGPLAPTGQAQELTGAGGEVVQQLRHLVLGAVRRRL
ncbi:MAG: hypothetical protein O2799_06830 [Planctomycetota bacterium]|nr:hypothetical protein [Planctomycetota bacterium]